jgi:chromate transporter
VKLDVLTTLAVIFGGLSLLAVGGANAVIPDMHRALVDARAMVSDSDFALLVALAQASPGPNVILVGLLGFQIAGVAGAAVSTVAMTVPSTVLAVGAMHTSRRLFSPRLRSVASAALAPITVGLILGSGYTLTMAAGAHLATWLLSGATVAFLFLRPKVNPLWTLGAAAVLGLAFRL